MNEKIKKLLETLQWIYAAICIVEGTQSEYRVLAPDTTIAKLREAIALAKS